MSEVDIQNCYSEEIDKKTEEEFIEIVNLDVFQSKSKTTMIKHLKSI